MTLTQMNRMLNQYKVITASRFEKLSNGFANDSYLVTALHDERYVVKVLRSQNHEGIKKEIAIQKALEKSAIVTPSYLPLQNGEFIGDENGLSFVIAEFIEGSSPKEITRNLAQSFGETLANIHNSLNPNKIQTPFSTVQWLNPASAIDEIKKSKKETRIRLENIIGRTNYLFDLPFPKVIIHGDLRTINVFADDDKISVVFDFETAEHAFRILDIAQTYLSLAVDAELEKDDLLRAVCDGYKSITKQGLTELEEKNMSEIIKYTAASSSAWCFNNDEQSYAENILKIAGV